MYQAAIRKWSVYHVITIDQSAWKEDHVVCVLCLNVSSSNSEMVSAFIAFTTALSTFRSWAILSASIPEMANNLKKSISFPVNAFLNAGQKLLHHWGRGHNSIRWWLQLPMFRGDLWDRGLFLFSGNRKLFSVRGDHEEGRLISIKVCQTCGWNGVYFYGNQILSVWIGIIFPWKIFINVPLSTYRIMQNYIWIRIIFFYLGTLLLDKLDRSYSEVDNTCIWLSNNTNKETISSHKAL